MVVTLMEWDMDFYPVVYANGIVADTVVKVPQMAESISDGTLKQFSKRRSQLLG